MARVITCIIYYFSKLDEQYNQCSSSHHKRPWEAKRNIKTIHSKLAIGFP